MKPLLATACALAVGLALVPRVSAQSKPNLGVLNVKPAPLASDPSVKVDYDIVYVRAPRFVKGANGKERPSAWPEIGHPTNIHPGYDLMLLHPDGKEEVLVPGGKGSVADPYVSFDGKWVYYAYFHDPARGPWNAGADIYKVHVTTRKVVRLTKQELTPNTGVADFATDFRTAEKGKTTLGFGVYNLGPCPLPGGKVAFVSNRDAIRVPRGYPVYALQLHVMDDDGSNIEKIGHLNVAGALHPVILKDGRIIFSSLESQGLRGDIQWGIWSIYPDGTNWGPVVSAFLNGGASDAWHFQTQLSDGTIVTELYYNQNTAGFGTYFRLPAEVKEGYAGFHPADARAFPDRDKVFQRGGPLSGPAPVVYPFYPRGMEAITRFATGSDHAANLSDLKDKASPRVGKVTHPCGAPDNHLLTVWTPGAAANAGGFMGGPMTDGGIYLIKNGRPIDEPGQMLLIKNDPNYNEQWPRPLVPYKRIYGIDEPRFRKPLANDGSASKYLPAGTPFGLVGTSSLYKRESFPNGVIPRESVTATGNPYAAFSLNSWLGTNWTGQGADAGLYDNSDIHAIRILAMEPATSAVAGKFYNKANERLRILGEIPVRHFRPSPDRKRQHEQPLDPDGNPDTSFLAKIPANVAWTFQMLDKDGMVLTMAQTWHQLRPGEIRNNCGGCHAHSQQPTPFEKTAAARSDYVPFDLTDRTPLLTSKKLDESGKKWDVDDTTGLRFHTPFSKGGGVYNVEYFRDVKPILERSCVACHSHDSQKPAGNLVLNPEFDLHGAATFQQRFHAVSHSIAMSGMKSVKGRVPFMQDPRYVRDFQSRRSLLVWKIHGRRTDGLPTEIMKGHEADHKMVAAIDFTGRAMPPPDAIAGAYQDPAGKPIKVSPLTDEDRRTVVRWIDLGCPIDWDFGAADPQRRGFGWMLDDQRPTLTLTVPRAGRNAALNRILVGMHDYDTGLDMGAFQVMADFALDGVAAGQNIAPKFKAKTPGVWELTLSRPLTELAKGTLTVSVKDRQGNITRIERTFSVAIARDNHEMDLSRPRGY